MVDKKILLELREITGIGMKDCVKALEETNNDLQKAIEFLRKKGIAAADKKSTRETNESCIFVKKNEKKVSYCKLSCETDFVLRNQKFQDFGSKLIANIFEYSCNSADELFAKKTDNNETFKDYFDAEKYSLGENIVLGEVKTITLENRQFYADYMHNKMLDNSGQIYGLVVFENGDLGFKENIQELTKEIAMQVVAVSPKYLSPLDIPEDVKQTELMIYEEKIKNSGKSGNIVDKIKQGMFDKFCQDFCLQEQFSIKESKQKVSERIKEVNKLTNNFLKIISFYKAN